MLVMTIDKNVTFHPELHSTGLYNTQKIQYGANGQRKMLLKAYFFEIFYKRLIDWYAINNMSNPHSRDNITQQTYAIDAQATEC